MLRDFFSISFLENSILNYCIFIFILLFGLIFKRFLSKKLSLLLYRILRKTAGDAYSDKFLFLLIKPIDLLILLIIVYISFNQLEFPHSWKLAPDHVFGIRMMLIRTFEIAIVLSVTWIALRVIDFMAYLFSHRSTVSGSKMDIQLIPFAKEAVKIIVVIISIFFILGAVFNLNIASLIAGLGIGGLAIALAAKETLENLLGSFTIFLDKPFVVGDFVKVSGVSGNVEKIGFRSTRLRTPDKTFLTVPNKRMVDAELDNISLRTQRRVVFEINLSYNTPADKLKKIVSEIQKLIENTPFVSKGSKVNFTDLGDNALKVMVQYFTESTDEELYLKTKEGINYKIMEIVYSNGCIFASKNDHR